ncbi:MAG: fluoride efflux transporter CrcB [Bacteroidia bacterium]
MEWLAIFIGGGTGSLLRYAISRALPTAEGAFPLATLLANIGSCLVLGLAWQYLGRHAGVPDAVRLLVLTGFCGGFSTFSTFSFETLRLVQGGHTGMALIYVGVSVGSCLAILWGIYRLV